MDIISKQSKNINGFQLTNLAPEYDKETNSWKCRNDFQPLSVLPSAQIHYTGRDHWVINVNSNSRKRSLHFGQCLKATLKPSR
jgi:hypothetical protein